MKKLLAIFTSVLLLCAMLPLGAVGVSAATSGTTGDCTWTLDGTHLTISGNGKMGDYSYEYIDDWYHTTAPWGWKITAVTIEDGVTSIGNCAFYFCNSLQSVTIGNSVTSIGREAFYGCGNLTLETMGVSVTTIGNMAFYGCNSLQSVTIPDGVTSIAGGTFSYCLSLTSVTIPDGVTSIIGSAFYWCESLTSVTIPDSVTYIGDDAFGYCDNLTEVYYTGSHTDQAAMRIYSGNEKLLDATWHYADDPIADTVTHSVMETENGNGLAFRFELSANGVAVKNRIEADLANATVNYLGKDCKLLGMGAVLTNNATIGSGKFTLEDVNDSNVLDIPAVYLQEVDEDSCAFAVRIINIPNDQLERTIYARPYYVVEVDGEEIVVYGDVDTASCAEYM